MTRVNKVLKTFTFLLIILRISGLLKMQKQGKIIEIAKRCYSCLFPIIIIAYIYIFAEPMELKVFDKSIDLILVNTVRTLDRLGFLLFPVVSWLHTAFSSNHNCRRFFDDLEKIGKVLRKHLDIKIKYRRIRLANILIFIMIQLATMALLRQFIVVILIRDVLGGSFFIVYFSEVILFITQRAFYVCVVFHYFVIFRCIRLNLMALKREEIARRKETILQIFVMISNSIEDFNEKFGLIAFLTMCKLV